MGKPRGYAFIEYEHERDMHCKWTMQVAPPHARRRAPFPSLRCRSFLTSVFGFNDAVLFVLIFFAIQLATRFASAWPQCVLSRRVLARASETRSRPAEALGNL